MLFTCECHIREAKKEIYQNKFLINILHFRIVNNKQNRNIK